MRFFSKEDLRVDMLAPCAIMDGIHQIATQYLVSKYLSELSFKRSEPAIYADSPQKIHPQKNINGFSIITPYFKHRDFFRACSSSVAAAAAELAKHASELRVEWIIVNNDPSISNVELRRLTSGWPNLDIKVMSGKDTTIVAALNSAIAASQYEWLLFLDCDDRLHCTALVVSLHYADRLGVRYISSNTVDIYGHGRPMRLRCHNGPADAEQQHAGMRAGHLKIIHKSLLMEAGPFPPETEGCQDFWLALNTGLRERIALVPEYLYEYRWHPRSVSTSKARRQYLRERNIVAREALSQEIGSALKVRASSLRSDGLAVIIRTTGSRMRLLGEAVDSVLMAGRGFFTPIVVVHGDEHIFHVVEAYLAHRKAVSPNIKVILCDRKQHRRGAPLNTGFSYAISKGFDAIGILDDDDILLPQALSAAETLRTLNVDIVYGKAIAGDRRRIETWSEPHQLLPFKQIVKANFIPTNAFFVSTKFLLEAGLTKPFPEDMHYLEDWFGFLAMCCEGAKAIASPYTIGLFGLDSDGNSEHRKEPEEFDRCSMLIRDFIDFHMSEQKRRASTGFQGFVDLARLTS
jgi:hypothetical protein